MAKSKVRFWDIRNLLVTLKVIVASIVTSAILLIPSGLAYWFMTNEMPMIGRGVSLLVFLAGLQIFGWLSTKFWGWR